MIKVFLNQIYLGKKTVVVTFQLQENEEFALTLRQTHMSS